MSDSRDIVEYAPHGNEPSHADLNSYTIFWKDNRSRALVKPWTTRATDLGTAREAAHFLVVESSNGIGVVLGVVED
jgi:hypothetical protein